MTPTLRSQQFLLFRKIQNTGIFRPVDFLFLDIFRAEMLTCPDLDMLEVFEIFTSICLELNDRALLYEDYEMLAQIRDAYKVYATVTEVVFRNQCDLDLMYYYDNTIDYYQMQMITLSKKHTK